MNTYVVVATFKSDVTPDNIRTLIPDEQAQAKRLEDEGKIGSIKIAMPRRTVFIEVNALDDDEASNIVQSLPMAKLWDLDVYLTTPPAGPAF